MANNLSLQLLTDLSVLSASDPPELKSIYRAALEELDLLAVDYQTIRDLVRLSGSRDISLHIILIALFSTLAEGSVCLKLSPVELEAKLAPLCGQKTGHYVRTIQANIYSHTSIIHVIDESAPALFDDPLEAFKPLVLVIAGDGSYLYFHKYHEAEKAAAGALEALLSRESSFRAEPGALASAVREVLHDNPACLDGIPVRLNLSQKLGAVLPGLKNFVLISGGPGTGKTFIVLTLLRITVRLGVDPGRIRIAAPTGRAAQKLTDSIHKGITSLSLQNPVDDSLAAIQGETLHRLLQYSPSRDDYLYNRNNPVPADLIVIDEASMIDIVLLGNLFEALNEGACLVMLGDRNQLPSVEAGAVLADLIPGDRAMVFPGPVAETIHQVLPEAGPLLSAQNSKHAGTPRGLAGRVIVLHESYRSEESIKTIAEGINRQDRTIPNQIPVWDRGGSLPDEGVWQLNPPGGTTAIRELRTILASWAIRHYESDREGGSYLSLIQGISGSDLDAEDLPTVDAIKKILARLDDARILSPLRAGLAGTAGINAYLMEKLGRTFDPSARENIFSGSPVIITKNDYVKELFNGDVGVVLRGRGGNYYGAFNRPDGVRLYPVETLPPFEPSFAITVHKSQGSEYGSVLLVLPDGAPGRLLTTEILYTGLTRAKKLVVILAAPGLLLQAIQNRTERASRILFK